MNFTFSDEQILIRDMAERFFRDDYGLEARRKHQAMPGGFCRDTWAQYADMGWLALGIPEDLGGIGGGAVDMAILMEAMGGGLAVEPFLATVVLGGTLVRDGASPDVRADLLPQLAAGELHLSFACSEAQSRYDLNDVRTRARADGGGFVLNGVKTMALHAGTADKIAVTARTAGDERDDGGVTVFLIDADAPGVTITDYATVDGLRAGDVTLEGVRVGADAVLGDIDGGLALAETVVDRAAALVSAEAAGLMAALTRDTVAFLKERKQFGRPLGDFQALQHRATEMYMETELTRSLAYMAAVRQDGGDREAARRAASQAKAKAGQAGRLIGQEAVQLHGGMGVTDEMPVGHYFKRLTLIDHSFGDRAHHLDRLADMS
ncbi:acyl-CoA dehydrogenase family protein [Thalassospiraceae bacterium LMO-SO8]|nr:acyl-CoA dehydrogenase family protein [Alphaproteobacteria bacterium LMO-S08]WND74864.1 acyl-CoA dehydrogenase family protein [Thalassospiraceae bacterium LMO-SO8]